MENWIIDTMEKFGYWGILFLIAVENIFPPIPSEIILTFGGFMTTKTSISISGVVAFSTIGSVLGAVVLYGVGMLIDIHKIEKLADRWGHIIRITRKDIHKANQWFDQYGLWTVFFCRLIPLVRSLISIPAGMAHMKFASFVLLTTLGTLIWNVLLVNIGAAVGSSWETILGYMDLYSSIVYGFLLLIFAIFAGLYLKKRVFAKK